MQYSDELVYRILQDKFGFNSFLAAQYEVIRQILDGQSCLAVMPTGSGKSLCFQLPALIFEGLTLIVSPMISLMKDQVMQLKALGIAAEMFNSSMTLPEQEAVIEALARQEVKLLYVAPETLLKQAFMQRLDSNPPKLIAIDEAHCISMWGHDFRPEYRQLSHILERYPRAVRFALTATAIPKVRDDICATLNIPPENQVVESFDRPNLLLIVERKQDSFAKLLNFIKRHSSESGIIYCMTRKRVDSITDKLQAECILALPYHAGLSDVERHRNQEAFIRDEALIMVATIAFGMGINKSNVRYVIHTDLPKSLETYYQEIGRAGRDGLPATCLFFYSVGDVVMLKKIIMNSDDPALNRGTKQHLDAMINYAETYGCRRKPILSWFGELYDATNCKMCDYCLREEDEKVDATLQAKMFLSAVFRCKEAYPADHIIKVLRGSSAKEVLAAGHQNLSVYGLGKQWTAVQWHNLYQALKREHAIAEGYPAFRLILNENSWEILHDHAAFSMPVSLAAILAEPTTGDCDMELFTLLAATRRQLAEERKVPPYIIFSDRSLRDMATAFPQDTASMASISGVGAYKLQEFAPHFLSVIKTYCEPRNIKQIAAQIAQPSTLQLHNSGGKSALVAQYVKSGHSLQDAMVNFGVQLNTIIEHLQRYLEADGQLDPQIIRSFSALDDPTIGIIKAAFDELGMIALPPVYHALKEEYSYLELKLVRLEMLAKIRAKEANPDHSAG
jgi:ATP-dependent DNA helicase RecQ